jgi:phosphonate transport system substrate-binding protein
MQLGLSAVMIGEQQDMILRWKKYLEVHLHRPVVFVQRRSYQETMDMFRDEKLDAGWICGAPHVRYKSLQHLLAVGVWKGRPLYQSYLIVPGSDTATRSIADLRGKIFGFSDPLSNSGHNVPLREVQRLTDNPDSFFSKTMYTYSHRKLVEGVAAGLLDGANVDGYVYEQMDHYFPELVAKTRLVQKSADYGFAPLVARTGLPKADFRNLQDTLLNMNNDAEGRALLAMMGLDKFIAGDEHLYDGIAKLMLALNKTRHAEKN